MPTTAATKPDSHTGKPRPPSAPLLPGWFTPPAENLVKRKPWMRPPSNRGEILESYLVDSTTKFWAGLTGVAFTFSLMFLFWWGYGWMEIWWLWLIVISPALIPLTMGKKGSFSAGSDWLICGSLLFNTYEFSKVKITTAANGTHIIELSNGKRKMATPQLWHLQKNPKLWDLVYNGILYSVANGAECNDKTRKFLHIYT